ncbi:B12-binding domain-containing radical SAM protein [Ketobacter sp. MCCC 1A13808]|nr:B12-binding domain-containing radical SAM protein [Ketobacter sp. MCCC 1A13808]
MLCLAERTFSFMSLSHSCQWPPQTEVYSRNFCRPVVFQLTQQQFIKGIIMSVPAKVLLVDLNNFARYPTLSIGYLASILRQAKFTIDVFSPLMVGVRGTIREARPNVLGLPKARLNHRVATSNSRWVRQFRNYVAKRQHSGITAHQQAVLEAFRESLMQSAPQAVLISTYLMYYEVCIEMCRLCKEQDIPVIIGGPYFVQEDVYAEWVKIDGLSGLIAGELELEAPNIINSLLNKQDVSHHQGVLRFASDGTIKGKVARPLKTLDDVPFPDFSDFPWHQYPNRIVPIVTGRGCSWGACSFCSDVTSTAGRTYRSRSPENVIAEIKHQYERYNVTNFVFVDLKLNSNLSVWRAIINNMQTVAPGAKWIASVHVGMEEENGLSAEDLIAAAKSGCVRLTTGLESGSQRIIDWMKKGTQLDLIGQFLKNARAAGISNRCTMIIGYPNETHEDIDASARFLADHVDDIERIMLNRLAITAGTPIVRQLKRNPDRYQGFHIVSENAALAQVEHYYEGVSRSDHRGAVNQLLAHVVGINSKELLTQAQDFEGVM